MIISPSILLENVCFTRLQQSNCFPQADCEICGIFWGSLFEFVSLINWWGCLCLEQKMPVLDWVHNHASSSYRVLPGEADTRHRPTNRRICVAKAFLFISSYFEPTSIKTFVWNKASICCCDLSVTIKNSDSTNRTPLNCSVFESDLQRVPLPSFLAVIRQFQAHNVSHEIAHF